MATEVITTRRRRYLLDNERVLGSVLMTPAVIYIVALVGFPFVLAIIYALSDVTTGSRGFNFVGFDNFVRILDDPVFLRSLRNTFVFAAISNILVVVLAKALAMILVADFKGKWVIRFFVLLPWTTPISLATIMWLWTLDSLFSPIDWVLRWLGLIESNSYFLGKPGLAMASVIIVHTWRIVPLAAVIMMAGLAAIPHEINDAAQVDGAGFWRKLFEITIPLMAPIIAVAVLFGVILTITDMSVVWVLTRGGPTNSTQVLATWSFLKGIEGGALSQGAAIALFLLPVLVGLTVVILRLARRVEVF
ncbi:MAG: sugar ABC transporter permease [Acidimicrobiia bacterium]|nr:sugar ABC transporter permease [Acidimicrobiia bacterium]MDH3397614.1 sugar ABC transporter permease [Acidimicrobiia bacterium]MDH5615458.1 sugar ABC transporter permease [Acidimicrobiia bacterium]